MNKLGKLRAQKYASERAAKKDKRDYIATRRMAQRHKIWPAKIFNLPTKSRLMSIEVKNQKKSNSCTSCAASVLYEASYFAMRNSVLAVDFKELYDDQDVYPDGDSNRHTLQVMHKIGVKVFRFPNGWERHKYKIKEYAKVIRSWKEYIFWLDRNLPIFASITRYEDSKGRSNWGLAKVVGSLYFKGFTKNVKRGHAFVIIDHGEDDAGEYLLLVNSYGKTWGKFKNGTCKLYKRDFLRLRHDSFIIFV